MTDDFDFDDPLPGFKHVIGESYGDRRNLSC